MPEFSADSSSSAAASVRRCRWCCGRSASTPQLAIVFRSGVRSHFTALGMPGRTLFLSFFLPATDNSSDFGLLAIDPVNPEQPLIRKFVFSIPFLIANCFPIDCKSSERTEVDTDKIEILLENEIAPVSQGNTPFWCQSLIWKKLMTAWVCDNNRGDRERVFFAFESLNPSIAFFSECSVLKVFLGEPNYRVKTDGLLCLFPKIVIQLVNIVFVNPFPYIRKKNVSRGFGLKFGKQQNS